MKELDITCIKFNRVKLNILCIFTPVQNCRQRWEKRVYLWQFKPSAPGHAEASMGNASLSDSRRRYRATILDQTLGD
jgi:hypothetical protein